MNFGNGKAAIDNQKSILYRLRRLTNSTPLVLRMVVDGTISGDRLDVGLSGARILKALLFNTLNLDQSGASILLSKGRSTI
jgi:hypothetical protein